MTEPVPSARYLVPALQRGLQLLALFTRATPQRTGAELSRQLNLPRASVFRMLQTLEAMGYVQRLGDSNTYQLSIAVLRLGFEYLASMELAEQGRPVLEALSAQTGLSSHLVVRDGTEVVFVAKAVGRSALVSSVQVGARLPAHATALGRCLLADLSLPQLRALYPQQPLPAFTAQTPKTLAALQQLVQADQARGYSLSQGGFEAGISTVAVPVLDSSQATIAAVSVTVPGNAIAAEQLPPLVAQVQAAAAQLSQARPGLAPDAPRALPSRAVA